MNIAVKYCLVLTVIAGLLTTCGKKEQPGTSQDSTAQSTDTAMASADSTPAAPYVFFNIDSLRTALDAGKHRIDQELTDPSKLKGYINTLSGSDPASIPYAIHYIKHHPAPAGSPVYDTLYKQLNSLYYLVSQAFSKVVSGPTGEKVLSRNHIERIRAGDPLPDDPELKNLLTYLDLYSLKVYAEEGAYYTGADPELFYNVFHRKASPQLVYYLSLLTKDLKEIMVGDNMLLISYQQLYQRTEAWGLFIAIHQNGGFLRQQAILTYRANLSILLRGLGNTPIFDTENQTLSPEIKTLYEAIIANSKDRVSKKIITDYYNFLSKNNFKRTDEVNTFLDQYDIPALFTQPV